MHKRLDRKGIELSINFIVILILALVLFGGGIALMYKIFNATSTLKDRLDSQTQERIEQLLEQGQRVVVPDTSKQVQRGKLVQFGLGINNELRETKSFTFTITPSAGLRSDKSPFDSSNPDFQRLFAEVPALYMNQAYEIENNKHLSIPFGFSPTENAEPGTYIFNIEVSADGQRYDSIQKVYVEVR